MLGLIHFIKGFLTIRVTGSCPERFMNLCSNHHIILWDIRKCEDGYLIKMDLQDFCGIKSFCRKTGTKVVVTERFGLPFLSVRIKKRIVFVLGTVLSIVFFILMSFFIWSIELEGNYYITDDVFMDFLDENGIHHGMRKEKLDMEQLEKDIRNHFELVTWTSARLNGSRLVIQIRENELQGETIQKDSETGGMDLVAKEDGTIAGIITRSGIPLVAEGDTVKKGDVLVSGAIPIMAEDGTVRKYEFCTADADVRMRVEKKLCEEISVFYFYKDYTGREKKRYFIEFGDKKLPLGFFTKKYAEYDVIKEKEQVRLFGSYKLPIFYGKEIRREYQGKMRNYTKQQVKEIFENKINKIIQTLDEKGVQIIEKNVTIKKGEKKWKMELNVTVVEPNGVLMETITQQINETTPEQNLEQ